MTRAKLKPVYVSLYGITRSDDIDRAVLLSLYPWLGGKMVSRIGTVSRPLLKAIRLDPDSVRFDAKSWTNLNDVVLCFDDLERCSLKVSDVLGAINQYVEHEKVKTIILCNEDAIRPEEKELYRKIKEKVVGRSVHFTLDHTVVLDAIIAKYNNSQGFHLYLSQHRNGILDLFRRSNSDNIRILRHAVENLQIAFDAVKKDATYAEAALQAMIRMILPLTFEYELHLADSNQIAEIATQDSMAQIAWALTKDGEPSHRKKHEVKYFDVQAEFDPPCKSVAGLVTSGLLDVTQFKNEIEQAYAPPGKFEAAASSLFGNFWHLSDEIFNAHFTVLWKAVTERQISSLAVYLRISYVAEFWADLKLIPLDRKKLRDGLTEAVEASVRSGAIKYANYIEDQFVTVTNDENPDVSEFRKFLIAKNCTLKRSGDEQIAREFLQSIRDNSADGMRKLVSEYFLVPVMAVLPVEETVDAIWELPNKTKALLRAVFVKRYLENQPDDTTRQEVVGLDRLRTALAARLERERTTHRPLSIVMIGRTVDVLAAAVSHLGTPPSDVAPVASSVVDP